MLKKTPDNLWLLLAAAERYYVRCRTDFGMRIA